jgi:glycine reductase complex component B subunit gamma
MIVVHYLNQFFAGLGSEDAAGLAPTRIAGAVGPGRGLQAAGLPISVTLSCGDNFFAEREADALNRLLLWLDEIGPDVLVCGPSFGSGRYGYACGSLAREAGRRGIPAVCAMTTDNPGVVAAGRLAYVVPSGPNVAAMRAVLPVVASLARRLGNGETIGGAADEGFLPRAARKNVHASELGADRAVATLLAKLAGAVRTEIEPPRDLVPPPRPVPDPGSCTVALVTESGCVPRGNPDRLPTRHADAWLRYSLSGVDSLAPEAFESVHAGFDTQVANADPNRLVPLDALRALEREGRIGGVHGYLYTTSGVDTPVSVAARFGQEIAAELVNAGVQAVILTAT